MRVLQLPRFGQIMERGTIVAWYVVEGQAFRTGDVIYEVETEKTTITVEATFDGILAHRLVQEGEEVPVGAVLALCWEPGEQHDPAALERAIAEVKGGSAGVHAATVTSSASSLPKTTIPEAAPQGMDDGGGVSAQHTRDPAHAKAQESVHLRPRITPRARRLAEEHGIDYTNLYGSGPGGVIHEDDIQALLAKRTDVEPSKPSGRVLRQTPVQQAMASAMTRSWRDIPQFVQTRTFSADKLLALRDQLRTGGLNVSLTDLIAHIMSRVVPKHPLVNATFHDQGNVFVYDDVNLAVAVTTDRGLVTPVLRRAQTLTLQQTTSALRDLIVKARAGKLSPDEVSGGTITLSNLGMFGVEWGTPIINPPQSCLVFVGTVREQVVLKDGRATAISVMSLSIAFDHRVLDGATAARFTEALSNALEDPGDVVQQ